MWCHVVLFGLPVFGLLLFWMSSVPIALATCVPLSAFSLWLAVVVMRALRSPVSTGAEALPGRAGQVMTADGDDIIVQVDGELWRAKSDEPLAPQQPVDVLAIEGLTLTVSPRRAESPWTAGAGGEGGQGAERLGGGALKYRKHVQID